ncbi:MAG: DUF512 domain-containing protein [Cellulosilyticaceae bacterium]
MKTAEQFKRHKIIEVEAGSLAEEMEIEAGDVLLAINNQAIKDVFDYRYLLADEVIEVLIQKKNGEEWILEAEKEYEEDLGLIFESDLMDELISCRNKCQFCFIDQLPPNMRKTVYLKDDDWRMSFLNGNYITLTNMSEEDIDRLIRYRLSPINISIHATDPEVRMALLNNRFAGKILTQIERLVEGGIEINGQIVLCKGINDGDVLNQTIEDLSKFIPHIRSLTVVPVGISKYREGLAHLEGFDELAAKNVTEIIHKWQDYYLPRMDTRFIFAADEFYVTGKVPLPDYESYEDFPVLDNGVGMLTKFRYELEKALSNINQPSDVHFVGSLATGCITSEYMKACMKLIGDKIPTCTIAVYPIVNEFFGEKVTVTGLLTGQDIINQLKNNKSLGSVLLLAENMLKCGEEVLLDDYTITDIEEQLGIKVVVVPNNGQDFLDTILSTKEKNNE